MRAWLLRHSIAASSGIHWLRYLAYSHVAARDERLHQVVLAVELVDLQRGGAKCETNLASVLFLCAALCCRH
jgi:hypothetical protein